LNDLGIEITQHIASNHMDMCRFSGLDDVDYGKVVGALNRVLEATATLAPSRMGSVLSADQRRTYLDSLRFNQIDARHATIKAAHAKTCNWLLSKSEYQDWLDVNKISEHHGFLWIKGKAAAGKSTIMKFVYANAKKKMTHTIIVSFFFNARGEDLEKSVLGMYRSLLFQLLEKLPELQNLFDFLGSTAISNGEFHGWDIEILKDIFGRAIKNLGNRCLACFIDALDECEEDEVREMIAFFEYLGQLAVSSQIRFHICFSSRHYPYITIEKSVQLNLEDQEGHQQDIANYLHSELKAGHSNLVEQIKAEILERASGIFLWVVLVVKMLNKEYDRGRIHALRKRLDEIPNELDELFKDILTRDGQNIEELILCLQWILCAKQPLKCEELYFAILAGVDPEALIAWSPEETNKQDMERFILSSSKGLAEITKSKHQTIQFIHESVRDFLRKNGLNRLRSDLGSNFTGLSHERLKRCCQNYMRVDISEYLPLGTPLPTASSEEAAYLRRLIIDKFPFLEYAVRNVLHHADAADGYGISQDSFLESFFLGDWINLNNLFERYQVRRYTSRVSLLYILAEENLPNLIRLELKQIPHMDIKGGRHCFPLLAAVAHGNENAVRALLMPDTGAWSDGNILYNHLSSSTVRNYQEATGYILKNKSEIKVQKDRTFLAWATEEGDVGLVKVLLATRKVDINFQTKNGLTLLSMAAARGHDALVQLLVAQSDIGVDARDDLRRTPLLRAAAGGHDAVVKLLMGRSDVDVDARDASGRTPLLHAAMGGHDAVVKLLMGRSDVNVNAKDDSGRTPLLQPAVGGHDAVVRLLMGRSDVDANAKDDSGRTPLLQAAVGWHDMVVKLLMGRSDVDVNAKDNLGWTPLSWAAAGGHDAVVKLLIERSDVDVNTKDDLGWTPLLWAAVGGNDVVVKLLMGRSDVDVNAKDGSGRTPLLRAAAGGHDAVVKLLMGRSDVGGNARDKAGDAAAASDSNGM
jgi:ankyrin repeat protein